uniref:NADPH oxidase 4 n=1 Tax=Podarcis muralis TaxID=64176 RepID=A0A670HUR3_PODMU
MCRILLSFLRGSRKVASRKTRRLLDKSKTFHVTCGVTICVFSVIHVAAHLVNALNFSVNYNGEFLALNAASYHGEDPRKLLFATVPGLTGVLMVLVLFLMSTASTYAIRVSDYDIFWYTHNLFFVFYFLLMLHVSGGVLKYQTNLKEHPPGCLNPNATIQEDRQFAAGFEKLPSENALEPLPGGLVELEPLLQSSFVCTEEPKFQAHFPEYIILHCPSVSSVESHPFTLTLCPTASEATFGVHVKVVGDWTERFRDLLFLHSTWDAEILPVFQQRRYPKLYVDGPFGSPFEECFHYEVSLCVAGGIGVTPFASILNTLLDGWEHYKLRRLYFVWVCRDIASFRWFADLLCKLHNKLWQENRPDFVNIQLYLSRTDGMQKIIGEKYQVLNRRLLIGRPRWKLLFNEIAKCNRHSGLQHLKDCLSPHKRSKVKGPWMVTSSQR